MSFGDEAMQWEPLHARAQPHRSSDLGQTDHLPQPEKAGQDHFLGQPDQTLAEENTQLKLFT